MIKNQGFTLSELMIVIAVLAILSAVAIPSFASFSKKGHLNKAKAALLENVHFMEQHYAQHKTFKKTSTTWPDLPHTATSKFDITFTSNAKGELPNRYRLRATPNKHHAQREKRYIEIDHNSNIKLCTKINNSTKCEKW